MSNLVVPRIYGVRPEGGTVKRFKGIGTKYSIPTRKGEILSRLNHFFEANGSVGFSKVQVRIFGAPAHPEYPNMLMDVMEFEQGHHSPVMLPNDWGRVPNDQRTPFEGLEALELEQTNQKFTDMKSNKTKSKPKSDLAQLPPTMEPVFDDTEMDSEEEALNEASMVLFSVVAAAQQLLGNSKPIKLGDQDGYLVDPVSMAELNLAVVKLNKTSFGKAPDADNKVSDKVLVDPPAE